MALLWSLTIQIEFIARHAERESEEDIEWEELNGVNEHLVCVFVVLCLFNVHRAE